MLETRPHAPTSSVVGASTGRARRTLQIPASRRRPRGKPITADVKHLLKLRCQASPETGHNRASAGRDDFSTTSRRPSAAAGCARLAALAVLAGQHQRRADRLGDSRGVRTQLRHRATSTAGIEGGGGGERRHRYAVRHREATSAVRTTVTGVVRSSRAGTDRQRRDRQRARRIGPRPGRSGERGETNPRNGRDLLARADLDRGDSRNRRGAQSGLWSRIAAGLSGGGGIRTHGPLARTPVFKTGAIDHSATPPDPV